MTNDTFLIILTAVDRAVYIMQNTNVIDVDIGGVHYAMTLYHLYITCLCWGLIVSSLVNMISPVSAGGDTEDMY